MGRAVASCGLPREELFVSTKLWNDDQGHDSTLRAFDASLHRLGLDHVDLYLIHWPKPSLDRYVETWRALETPAADGRARAIGVSNFQVAHLQRLLDETSVVPAVNQLELHLGFQQEPLRHFHAAHGVVTEAWSRLGQGQALQDPLVVELAGRQAAPPPRSAALAPATGQRRDPQVDPPGAPAGEPRAVRLRLSEAETAALARLESGQRLGPTPTSATRNPGRAFPAPVAGGIRATDAGSVALPSWPR